MEKGFYHPERGFWQTLSEPPADILEGYPEGTIEVPVSPSSLHTFDGEVWIAPTQEEIDADKSETLRLARNLKLYQEVDPLITNPMRWADLTESKRAEWTQYRTDLLNLPDQAGFPNTVTWPTNPTE